MTHSIEIWRAFLVTAADVLALPGPVAAAELPLPEETDDPVIELCRQYPGLPRAIAEYLAR